MQTALNFDATAGELDYRISKSNFNMKVGQSSLQSTILCKRGLNENLLKCMHLVERVIEKVKQLDFIEDPTILELTLAS
jgi:hypothetical protein